MRLRVAVLRHAAVVVEVVRREVREHADIELALVDAVHVEPDR